jgi:hypothetical protein
MYVSFKSVSDTSRALLTLRNRPVLDSHLLGAMEHDRFHSFRRHVYCHNTGYNCSIEDTRHAVLQSNVKHRGISKLQQSNTKSSPQFDDITQDRPNMFRCGGGGRGTPVTPAPPQAWAAYTVISIRCHVLIFKMQYLLRTCLESCLFTHGSSDGLRSSLQVPLNLKHKHPDVGDAARGDGE